MNLKLEYKKAAGLAAVLIGVMFVLNWVISFIPALRVDKLFSINVPTLITPVSTTVGGKIMSWISGIVPNFDITTLLLLFVSAFVSILVGGFLVEKLNLPVAKGRTGKIASVIMYGTLPIYLIIVGFSIPSVSLLIGLALYVAISSYLAGYVAQLLKVEI